jgi:hypothetical protein
MLKPLAFLGGRYASPDAYNLNNFNDVTNIYQTGTALGKD